MTSDTPGSASNSAAGTGPREPQLHLVVGEVAQPLDAVELHDPALADDRDAVAGALDLAQDVAGQEDRPPIRLRLAHQLEERLLDERVEARGRLVEDQQLRAMLERDHERRSSACCPSTAP